MDSMISESPHCGLLSKRPSTWTTVPVSATAKRASTSSQDLAWTVAVRSAIFSASHSPPRFVGRRLRSRTA